MHLFNYQDDEYLLCSSFGEEYLGQPGTDYFCYDAQVFKTKPTHQQAQAFYQFFVPALTLPTGTLLAGQLEQIDFDQVN